jgi:hypothetical protein
MADEHIHVPGDGRGARLVYVDGELVKQVVYADTKSGVVRFHGDIPTRAPDGVHWVEHERRGTVEVKFIDV